MNEIATYAQAIIQFLSNMDVKASGHNVQQISAIHAAVEKIKALSDSAPIAPREIPVEDEKK
jgi:hypothetical protein